MRYFIDSDNSYHWYLVEASKRAEWDAWLELDLDDEKSWEIPEFAQRIGAPSWYTFTDPIHGA